MAYGSGTISGSDGISKFVEDRETRVFRENRTLPQRKESIRSNNADIGDVQVIRIMSPIALGEGNKSLKNGRVHMWMG